MNRANSLGYGVIKALLETDEWEDLWSQDPWITSAADALHEVLERVRSRVSDQLMNELFTAMAEVNVANQYAAILYGMRVARAIQDGLDHPEELSAYIYSARPTIRVAADG